MMVMMTAITYSTFSVCTILSIIQSLGCDTNNDKFHFCNLGTVNRNFLRRKCNREMNSENVQLFMMHNCRRRTDGG